MLSVGEFRLAAETDAGPMYVHAGLEGSVISLTDTAGEVVEKFRYTAFGLLTVLDELGNEKTSSPLTPWLYHGRLYEESTGLHWMRMRHYSPTLGRFLQPDPAGVAGGLNLYAYASNNPLKYFDPWCLWPAPNAGDPDGDPFLFPSAHELSPLELEEIRNPTPDDNAAYNEYLLASEIAKFLGVSVEKVLGYGVVETLLTMPIEDLMALKLHITGQFLPTDPDGQTTARLPAWMTDFASRKYKAAKSIAGKGLVKDIQPSKIGEGTISPGIQKPGNLWPIAKILVLKTHRFHILVLALLKELVVPQLRQCPQLMDGVWLQEHF